MENESGSTIKTFAKANLFSHLKSHWGEEFNLKFIVMVSYIQNYFFISSWKLLELSMKIIRTFQVLELSFEFPDFVDDWEMLGSFEG